MFSAMLHMPIIAEMISLISARLACQFSFESNRKFFFGRRKRRRREKGWKNVVVGGEINARGVLRKAAEHCEGDVRRKF